MSQAVFGDDFTSEMLPGNKAMKISRTDGTVDVTVNLRSLSDKLLSGSRKVDRVDLAVAGAAISHLLATMKKD